VSEQLVLIISGVLFGAWGRKTCSDYVGIQRDSCSDVEYFREINFY